MKYIFDIQSEETYIAETQRQENIIKELIGDNHKVFDKEPTTYEKWECITELLRLKIL